MIFLFDEQIKWCFRTFIALHNIYYYNYYGALGVYTCIYIIYLFVWRLQHFDFDDRFGFNFMYDTRHMPYVLCIVSIIMKERNISVIWRHLCFVGIPQCSATGHFISIILYWYTCKCTYIDEWIWYDIMSDKHTHTHTFKFPYALFLCNNIIFISFIDRCDWMSCFTSKIGTKSTANHIFGWYTAIHSQIYFALVGQHDLHFIIHWHRRCWCCLHQIFHVNSNENP